MSVEAAVVDARVAEMPRVDAGESQPGADAGVSCVGGGQTEVCDGKDNDCDGQVDEGVKNACGACGPVPAEECDGIDNDCNGKIDDDVGPAWYRDCDGDGFAVNAVGKVEGCKKPAPASDCAGWTNRDPADPAQQDCDDTAAQRFPGAGFGLATKASGDLNCDGKVERKVEYRDSNIPSRESMFEPNVCLSENDCDCWNPTAIIYGYEGFDKEGFVKASITEPYYVGRSDYETPCSVAAGDALGLVRIDARCQTILSVVVIARNLCR